jgi:hypothetical protein
MVQSLHSMPKGTPDRPEFSGQSLNKQAKPAKALCTFFIFALEFTSLIYPPTSLDKRICTQIDFVGKYFPINHLCEIFSPTPPRHVNSWAF